MEYFDVCEYIGRVMHKKERVMIVTVVLVEPELIHANKIHINNNKQQTINNKIDEEE
jgi:hypothetical protein